MCPVLLPNSKLPPTPFRPERIPPSLGGIVPWVPPDVSKATTIRYVRKTGSDSNGGTSPADAWLTIGKSLTTASPGTVIYIGAGIYREILNVTIIPTSSSPVWVIGDIDGSKTGDAGMVQLTAYTTDDKTAPSSSPSLTTNSHNSLNFQNIFFVGGNSSTISLGSSTYISFTDCAIFDNTSNSLINLTAAFGVSSNCVFNRCYFLSLDGGVVFSITCTQGTGNDYDLGLFINNCFSFSGGAFASLTVAGSGNNKGNGIHIRNSTLIHPGGSIIVSTNAGLSNLKPNEVYNSLLASASATALSAGASSGLIIEDYNRIISFTPRSNVGVGSHTITSVTTPAVLFHFGQEKVWSGVLRSFGEPMSGSPLLSYGAFDSQAGLTDLFKRIRLSNLTGVAVGALERGNNLTDETSTTFTGANAISVIGSGSQEFDILVDAGTITLSVYCQFDSNYVGPLPEMRVINATQVGVGDVQVSTSMLSQGTFQQYSITINPTASGIITVRFEAHDTSGISKTVFDTFTVA